MCRSRRACALLLAIAVALAPASCGGSDPEGSRTATTTAAAAGGVPLGPAFRLMDALPGVLKTAPPWPNNVGELQQRLRAIGLPALTAEGEVVHTHQHLDIFVDGERVPVPADIGIARDRTFISPLHTHAPQAGEPPDGILHVESPTQTNYTLGQFFAVWGLRLNVDCIGAKCADEQHELHMWVNGRPVSGDPTRLLLQEHQQIVLAYGTREQMPARPQATYDWDAVDL